VGGARGGMQVRVRHGPGPRGRCLALAVSLGLWAVPAGAGDARETLRAALEAACEPPADAPLAGRVPGARAGTREPIRVRGMAVGTRWRLTLADGGEVVVERIAPGGQLRRLSAEHRVPHAGALRPRSLAVAGPGCAVRLGRRLVYDGAGTPAAVEILDAELEPTGERELMNPPVPPGTDPGGVRVGMVDSGVNYRLSAIHPRLARDAEGTILGYDYWDRDRRPFDANPARSPFFPQRHGTRTASLLLREAPMAALVPYRYPRPDMRRMRALVADAAAHGVVIINMSLGSDRREDWAAFEAAARAHPGILFVASAGNQGRDIDADPVYPAALALDNLLSVTSSTSDGRLARGSNRGRESVDLLVPGEEQLITEFDGRRDFASGASYAAVRVSALAACLLAANPRWRAPELKAALLARAQRPPGKGRPVAHGFIPDPSARPRGACPAQARHVEQVATHRLGPQALHAGAPHQGRFTHRLRAEFVLLRESGWRLAGVYEAVRTAARILRQCGVFLDGAPVHVVDAPERLLYYRLSTARQLVARIKLPKPTVYFMRDTRRATEFDAEAFARSNSQRFPELQGTVWVSRLLPHPGVGLAHELVHVLSDSGAHLDTPGNVMRPVTAPDNTVLTDEQCRRVLEVGVRDGLLEPM